MTITLACQAGVVVPVGVLGGLASLVFEGFETVGFFLLMITPTYCMLNIITLSHWTSKPWHKLIVLHQLHLVENCAVKLNPSWNSLAHTPWIHYERCRSWMLSMVAKAHSPTLQVPQVVSTAIQPIYHVLCPHLCGPSLFICDYPF
jgi:hypothetical protein